MPKKSWATKEQQEWLFDQLSDLRKAQDARTVPTFFERIYREFHDKWPVPSLTPEEIAGAGGEEEKVRTTKEKASEARIHSWFYNKTRGSTSGTATRGLLNLKNSSRLLHPWQAFARMYGEELKARVDTEWETYQHEHPDVTHTTRDRFIFHNQKMQDWYEEAESDVKGKVEEFRQQHKDGIVEGDEGNDANHHFQENIDKLPRTIEEAAKEIYKLTGWACTIITGGPMPKQGGAIQTLVYNQGTTPKGHTLEKFLGEAYDLEFLSPFDRFLEAAFDQETRNLRALSTPSPNDSPQPQDGPDGSNACDGVARVAMSKEGSSEYEQEREANIARNKKLLADLGLDGGTKELVEKGSKKGKGRKIMDESSGTADPDHSSPAIITGSGSIDTRPVSMATTTTIPGHAITSPGLSTEVTPMVPTVPTTVSPSKQPTDSSAMTPFAPSVQCGSSSTEKPLVDAVSNLLPFLKGISTDSRWATLLSNLILFEHEDPPKSRLPTASRPGEVAAWLKTGRRVQPEQMPSVKNIDQYAIAWNSWWHKLQPSWRGGALSRDVPPGASWGHLLCGGASGLLTVVLALAWWMQAVSKCGDTQLVTVQTAIDEVSWALIQMRTALASGQRNGKKREAENDTDESPVVKRAKKGRR